MTNPQHRFRVHYYLLGYSRHYPTLERATKRVDSDGFAAVIYDDGLKVASYCTADGWKLTPLFEAYFSETTRS
jgi:hypothetical protein